MRVNAAALVVALAMASWAVGQSALANGICSPAGSAAASIRPTAANPAVVRVTNSRGWSRAYGSGTLIDMKEWNTPPGKAIVLTCQHLFREGIGTISICAGGQCRPARLVAQDAAWDLAILEVAAPGLDCVAIASEFPKPGESLTACGFGPDGRYQCVRGQALGYGRTNATSTYDTLQVSGRARDGDSGGPVFNERGSLVAVIWGTDGRIITGTYCGRVRKFFARVFGLRRPPAQPLVPVVPSRPPVPESREPPHRAEPPRPTPPAISAEEVERIVSGLLEKRSAISAKQVERIVSGLLEKRPAISAEEVQRIVGQETGGLAERIDAVADSVSEGRLRDLIRGVAGQIVARGDSASEIPGGAVWPAIVVPVLTALGWSTPPSVAVIAALWLVRGLIRHRQAKRTMSSARRGTTAKTAAERIVVQQAEPAKTIVRRDPEFIEIEVPSRRLRALEMAMAEQRRRYPGSGSTIDAILEFAKQYESGLKGTDQ